MRQNFTQKFLLIFAFLSFFAAGYQANAQADTDPCSGDNGGMIAADNGTGTDTTCPRTAPGTFLSLSNGSGVGGGPNVSYQWFVRNTNGGQFTEVPSYGTAADQTGRNAVYTPQALADGIYEYIRFRYTGTELNSRICARTSNIIQVIAQDRNRPVITRAPLDTSVSQERGVCSAVVKLPRRGTGTSAAGNGTMDARGVQATDNCTGFSSRTNDTLAIAYFINGVRIAQNDTLGHRFPIGVTRVTVRVTDSTGNFADTAFNVGVRDTSRPVFGASPRLLVRFTEPQSCSANITGSETAPNYTDCSPLTVTYQIFDSTANNTRTASTRVTPNTGTTSSTTTTTNSIGDRTFQRGTYYIAFSAVDSAGNQSNTMGGTQNDTIILRVLDNTRPTIAAPANDTITLSSGCTVTAATLGVTNFDSTGTTRVTTDCFATASATNTTICTNARSNDNCAPVAKEVTYGPNDMSRPFGYVNPNNADSSNTFFRIGANRLAYVAFDSSGNRSDTSFQTIFIRDNSRPQVFCQANENLNTSGDSRVTAGSTACTFRVSGLTNSFNDNCAVRFVRYTFSQNNAVYFDTTVRTSGATGSFSVNGPFRIGQTTVKSVAFDTTGLATTGTGQGGTANTGSFAANNGSDTCSFIVTLNDNTAPVVTCKPFTLRLNSAGSGTLTSNDVLQSGTDCGTLTYTLSKSAFDCSNIGANTVTLTATDASGNSSTCTATVTVMSNITFSVATTGEFCTNSGTLTISNVQGGSGTNTFDIIATTGTDNNTGNTSGQYTGLTAGSYTVRVFSSGGANNSTCFKDTTVNVGASQKATTDPRIVARAINNFFSAPGTSNEVRVTISEIGGQPADSIAFVVPKETGYTIAMGTGFDNASYTVDNSNANFVIFRKNQVNGVALACGASSEVSLTITRNANETQGRPAFPISFILLPPSEQSADYRFNDRFTVLFSAAQGQ